VNIGSVDGAAAETDSFLVRVGDNFGSGAGAEGSPVEEHVRLETDDSDFVVRLEVANLVAALF